MCPYLDFFGKTVGSYGLMMALSFLLVGALSLRSARQQHEAAEDILIVGACAIALALVGGKLLYILATFSILQLWNMLWDGDLNLLSGGIVFYGGLIGGLIGAVLGARIAGLQLWKAERIIVPYIPLGHAVGRVGCFLAGCCYGRAYDGFLAVHYPNSVAGLSPEQGYFPIQLVEAAWNLLVTLFLVWFAKEPRKPFSILSAYLSVYAVGRFTLEWFRGDADRGIFCGFSLSQWISIALLAACALRQLYLKLRTARV